MLTVEEVEFSLWLENQITVRGWRPADLAKAAELPAATVARVLNGDRNAGPEVATAIAKALSLSPEFVFRQAGLLPEIIPADPDPTFEEIAEILRGMTPEERRDVVDYALWRLRRRNGAS